MCNGPVDGSFGDMYTPEHFSSSQTESALLDRYGFGLLITAGSDELWTTHLPYLVKSAVADGSALVAMHMARGNSHWRAIEKQPRCRFVVQGAHGYVSPAWYETRAAVPTWNYEAIHLDGEVELVFDPDELWEHLLALAGRFEEPGEQRWAAADLTPEFLAPLLRSIVGVRFHVDAAQAKQKLSQNRSVGERRRVARELRDRGNTDLARSMEALLPEEPAK